jgi:hypothetical protein
MSLFAQALKLIDRKIFNSAVDRHGAEKGAKGFKCWTQFVSMLFAQFADAASLREICGGLAVTIGKVSHLGLKRAPSRSTLSYANEHRSWRVFEDVFYSLYDQAGHLAGRMKRRFKFKNPLMSIDATVIELCAEVFDWARYQRTKGAVKLHLALNHRECLPCWAVITEGREHEINAARTVRFEPGTIVAVDRGYFDFALFGAWCASGVFFVTRMKTNTRYRVIKRLSVPKGVANIISDEIIELTGKKADQCPFRLRRVVAWDAENEREIVLLTNHLEFAASTISRIYKDRWQIENFFKALKQNLRIKTFVGTSENAVRIQIWTALIAILMLKILTMMSRCVWSLSHLGTMFRMCLMSHAGLRDWLDDPEKSLREDIESNELPLFANMLDSKKGGQDMAPGFSGV